MSFALKQLAALKRGDVRLKDLDMWIAGEAEDVASYRAVKSALANSLPKGIKLTNDMVTAPVVSPFTWSAQLAEGRFVLSGYVPSEAARAELLAAAKAELRAASSSSTRCSPATARRKAGPARRRQACASWRGSRAAARR